MNTFDTISHRRSIRRFTNKIIPKEVIQKVLDSAILAPSAKNRQPWKFIVVTADGKDGMINAMQSGIENEKSGMGLLPNSVHFISGAENTLRIMSQAPVTVFVFNTESGGLWNDSNVESKLFNIANVQSIGASIENMILTATDLGIGSLWICDVFFAYRELCDYFNTQDELIAAISLGYSDEVPNARPRKKLEDIVEWR